MFFFLAFLVFNLLTANRYPIVWIDEVQHTDPAANLYFGNGFTSTAWSTQTSGEFWAGNVPLHSALLFLWINLFGFSLGAVRSINYVYMVAALLLVWRATVRLNLVQTARSRLILLVLLVCGYSMIFSYSSGRYDCLGMLIVAGMFYAHTVKKSWQKMASMFTLSFIAPWAGLQLLPLVAVGAVMMLLFLGRRPSGKFLVAVTGAAAGTVGLALFYAVHGVLKKFLGAIRPVTTIGLFEALVKGHYYHSNRLPKDFSFWPIFALALLLFVFLARRGLLHRRSPLVFGLLYSICVSAALVFSGRFPTYYGWMIYAPLCVCVCATLSEVPLSAALRRTSAVALGASIVLGVLLHGAAAVYNWPDRDYNNVIRLVNESVTNTDNMCGDWATYYAAKTVVHKLYLPLYLPMRLENERRQLTVLVIAPRYFAPVTAAVGGEWVPTGQRFVPKHHGFLGTKLNMGFLTGDYELAVYRRAEPSL